MDGLNAPMKLFAQGASDAALRLLARNHIWGLHGARPELVPTAHANDVAPWTMDKALFGSRGGDVDPKRPRPIPRVLKNTLVCSDSS